MPLANYLRRRGATYSVRVPVPQDLQDHVGNREIVKALGKVRDPAEAKRKGAERVQEIRAWFERLRSGAKLTSEMIERECQDVAREGLEFLKVLRLGRAPQRSTAMTSMKMIRRSSGWTWRSTNLSMRSGGTTSAQ
jgi:hypothetical protein